MAEKLELIARPVKNELDKYEIYFRESLETNVPLLKEIINYLFKQSGKQLRPLLIFLSASLNGKITQLTYNTATAIEMLHTATLVHDDVVDDANERRGMKSINAVWKSKTAVLVGDYLLAQALMLVTQHKAYDMLELMTFPIKQMSEGELLQIQKAHSMDTTEEDYYKIINKKTAALFAACTATGAKSAGASTESINYMRDLGEMLGMAFQIRDDIFDYQNLDLTGKPAGNDIIERKITLPLILALEKTTEDYREKILGLIKNASTHKENIELVRNFVMENKGLEDAMVTAQSYRDKAIGLLRLLKSGDVQESFIQLAYYITDREK